jgi:hypothetical protein
MAQVPFKIAQAAPKAAHKGASPDSGSRVQFTNGFRYQRRRFPGHDLLKGIEEGVTQFRSRTGERIQQYKQQQKGGEYAQEIIEREPSCLSEDFILPALATCSFRQLPPRKSSETPQIGHGSS